MPVEERGRRIDSVADVVKRYMDTYAINHRPASVAFSASSLKNITRFLGAVMIPDVTETRVREYMAARQAEGASGRSINPELGELSRAMGRHWKVLWHRVRKLEERKDVGRALTPEEEAQVLAAADASKSPHMRTMVRAALMTGMRAGELSTLRWSQVDLGRRMITVGRAKTAAGTGRQIPMSAELGAELNAHADWFTSKFGKPNPAHYLFPFGSPLPKDPTKPTVELKTAWETIRKSSGVSCRWHDLRHTACTKLAEASVPEFVMQALMGHMSRAMLERYSHVRIDAKRLAVEAMSTRRKNEVPKDSPKVTASELPQ